jgi:glutamate formiminotransferase/formiminotetrahydrofolate cyclodeaminase
METRTLQDYRKALNSDAPSPGGGSAAAYVASLAVSLVNMALKISKKRKRFLQYTAEEQAFIERTIVFFNHESEQLLDYMQQDEVAFSDFLFAMQQKRPLESYRFECLRVPSELAARVLHLISLFQQVRPYIVDSIIGDLHMGLYFSKAVLQGCKDNIEINLQGLEDVQRKENALQLIKTIEQVIQSLA